MTYLVLITSGLHSQSTHIADQSYEIQKCGEKSKTAEHNSIYGNKTAGSGSAKAGSGRLFSIFPRTSGFEWRKYAANSRCPDHNALFVKRNRR